METAGDKGMGKNNQVKVTGRFRGEPWEARGDRYELASAKDFLKKLIESSPVSELCEKGVDPGKLFEFFLRHATDDGEFWKREGLGHAKEIKAAYRAFEKLMSALRPIRGLPGLSDFEEIKQQEHCAFLLAYMRLIEERPKHRPRDRNEDAFILGLAKLVEEATRQFHDRVCQEIFTLTFGYQIEPESYRIRRERLLEYSQRESRLSPMATVESQSKA